MIIEGFPDSIFAIIMTFVVGIPLAWQFGKYDEDNN